MRANGAVRVAAVVLAGGRGERLGGVVKAALRVGGVRLIERVLVRIAACDPIGVAHGPHDPVALDLPAHVTGVADLAADYAGPLAGFAAAVAALPEDIDLLVATAVDAPFLPSDYVERLVRGLGDAPAALARYGGQAYPTNSIWRVARFRDLPARVLAGSAPRSLKSLAAAASAAMVDWAEGPEGDPFANINTAEDLAQAEADAAALAAGL